MKTETKRLYEAMFLVDSGKAADDWDGIIEHIRNILTKTDAEIVKLTKWDERRLAYPIERKSQGTYILIYFKSDGSRISEIERDAQLSEFIMRALILKADHITEEEILQEKPETQPEEAAPESEKKEDSVKTEEPNQPESPENTKEENEDKPEKVVED